MLQDVAGRGLDVPKVDLVIQFSAPQKVADYVHRVGRTARAGRKGRAVIFLNPNETDFIGVLEEKRIRIAQEEMQLSLDALLTPTGSARKPDEAATNLQHKFEEIVNEDKEMHGKACKGKRFIFLCLKMFVGSHKNSHATGKFNGIKRMSLFPSIVCNKASLP